MELAQMKGKKRKTTATTNERTTVTISRRTIITIIGIVLPVIAIVIGVWQGYLPVAERSGWWPYPPVTPVYDIRIIDAQYDAPSYDTAENLNGEWIQIKNAGSTDVDMSGWKLSDLSHHEYIFGNFILPVGGTVKIYSGNGTDSLAELYWGSKNHIWNNDFDTATLYDSSGNLICSFTE
jgi:hypothetical protein